MNSKIHLKRVEFIPKVLDVGVLYVSDRFQIAVHLCPCGCETKIITPLGPCEWSFSERKKRPSLYPSIGNWQIPCKSHYWITNGEIKWSYSWTEEEIEAGRKLEKNKRELYYAKKNKTKKGSFWKLIKNWICGKHKGW